jgi:hypothetical protein
MLNALTKIHGGIVSGSIKDMDLNPILPLVLGCQSYIDELNSVIEKTLQSSAGSCIKRTEKALASIFQDSKIEKAYGLL